ncbi:hypothetical protein HYS00_04135, partial [Candidatus Microgenomates bacterium]|nr:hypothetical protein [Candidatus Microgenomates bacterium]
GNSVGDLVSFRGGIPAPAVEQPPIQTDTGTTASSQPSATHTTILPFDPAQSTHIGPARYSKGITDKTSPPR